jgi:4-amino-4-deoxy-L-arabinose transferase-like glycosyltransferase
MAGRRGLYATLALAAALHAAGIARTSLPAQDGLKFIRVARAFQTQPWTDVVRGSDQHPLYPALVALAEPVVALVSGHSPTTWRITAQVVAAAASLALLFPLHGLTRRLFGPRVAGLAALGFVLLPLPMAVGHDTLSDSLALLCGLLALRLGLAALASGGWLPAVGCGVVAGFGYLTRPEVLVVPAAVVAAGAWRALRRMDLTERHPRPQLAGLSIAFLVMVGSYALVKGEVSEKLALRGSAAVALKGPVERKAGQGLPPGLNDARWDFSPKEEPDSPPRRTVGEVVRSLWLQWAEGLGAILAFFALWGLVRDGAIRRVVATQTDRPDPDNVGRGLLAVYLGMFTLVLIRHELRMGYLSDRHVLTLVVLSLPWAAAGVFVCARGIAVTLGWGPRLSRGARAALLVAAVAAGVVFQAKPAHPSRWGHQAAGEWLSTHAKAGEAVLDTRGWAAFVSGLPAYDYWHVRQALTDSHLSYVVVGADELNAPSRRAATLRAVLAYAGQSAARFPLRKGGRDTGVWVYRFERPASWEGLRP